jgi:hypothetical protein
MSPKHKSSFYKIRYICLFMKVFKTISSFTLILLVLISATSFKVGMHFCNGKVQDIALLAKAEPCALEKSLPPCHRHQQPACCDDETVIHEGDEIQYSSSTEFAVNVTSVDVLPAMVLLTEIIPTIPVRYNYYNYDPPLRAVDLTVEHRVFLI